MARSYLGLLRQLGNVRDLSVVLGGLAVVSLFLPWQSGVADAGSLGFRSWLPVALSIIVGIIGGLEWRFNSLPGLDGPTGRLVLWALTLVAAVWMLVRLLTLSPQDWGFWVAVVAVFGQALLGWLTFRQHGRSIPDVLRELRKSVGF